MVTEIIELMNSVRIEPQVPRGAAFGEAAVARGRADAHGEGHAHGVREPPQPAAQLAVQQLAVQSLAVQLTVQQCFSLQEVGRIRSRRASGYSWRSCPTPRRRSLALSPASINSGLEGGGSVKLNRKLKTFDNRRFFVVKIKHFSFSLSVLGFRRECSTKRGQSFARRI